MKIENVCVVGAGVMGREIALNAAFNGYNAALTDSQPGALQKARAWAESYLEGSVAKGKATAEQKDAALGRLSFTGDLPHAAAGAGLVIEAIVEKLDIKLDLFRRLDGLVSSETILASNSSYIPSSRLVEAVSHPERLANLHYFNPAMRMQLVEIVRGPHTSDATVEALRAFVASIGKISILVKKEIEGFIVNRILKAVANEAFFLLENDIASFEDIDLAAEKGLNYPLGPFRLMDFTGLDITFLNRQRVFDESGKECDRPPHQLEERYRKGDYGRKTGKGWYSYT